MGQYLLSQVSRKYLNIAHTKYEGHEALFFHKGCLARSVANPKDQPIGGRRRESRLRSNVPNDSNSFEVGRLLIDKVLNVLRAQ
jgi:hypothetical protein